MGAGCPAMNACMLPASWAVLSSGFAPKVVVVSTLPLWLRATRMFFVNKSMSNCWLVSLVMRTNGKLVLSWTSSP